MKTGPSSSTSVSQLKYSSQETAPASYVLHLSIPNLAITLAHPAKKSPKQMSKLGPKAIAATRRSSLQAAELGFDGKWLTCDRNRWAKQHSSSSSAPLPQALSNESPNATARGAALTWAERRSKAVAAAAAAARERRAARREMGGAQLGEFEFSAMMRRRKQRGGALGGGTPFVGRGRSSTSPSSIEGNIRPEERLPTYARGIAASIPTANSIWPSSANADTNRKGTAGITSSEDLLSNSRKDFWWSSANLSPFVDEAVTSKKIED